MSRDIHTLSWRDPRAALVAIVIICCGPSCAVEAPPNEAVGEDTVDGGDTLVAIGDASTREGADTLEMPDIAPIRAVNVEPPVQLSDYPLAVWTDPILSEHVQWLGADSGPTALAANGSTLWRIDGDETTAIAVGSKLDPGDIISMATLPTGEIVVAATDTIAVVNDDSLGTWAGTNALSGLTFTDLASAGDQEEPRLWIAASNGLHLWSGGSVAKVVPQGVGMKNAQIAVCGETMWVAAEGDVYGLEQSEGQWAADALEQEGMNVTDITCDEGGRVWLVSDGQVSYRGGDGQWKELPEGLQATGVWAQPSSKDAWLRSLNGLWLVNGPSARPVETPLVAHVGAAHDGRLWIGGPSGLSRLSPGRAVSLVEWPGDNVIAGPLVLTLELETPDKVETISATVGNHSLTIQQDPWAVEMLPATYGEGLHTLNITVDYVDTALSSSLSLPFTVVLVSWTDDIEPIATPRCATCHGAEGSSGLKLFNAAQWKTYHSMIVPVIQSGVMPPGGNLSPDEVQLIKLWGSAGFPE